MIYLQNISKRFPHAKGSSCHAVKDVSLTIKSGEIFGLIGPSGAGKSTLLRLIALLERPDNGALFIDDNELTKLSAYDLRLARQRIGFIFQQFNLFANRTVAGNVAFGLEVAGYPKDRISKRVAECLEITKLADKADQYPSQLSGGQKQRVGIARALAPNPSVILADEPTSALDPHSTKSVLRCLSEINQRFGVTIIVVTHEMKVVHSICDRAGLLKDGSLLEVIDLENRHPGESELARSLLEAA